MKTVDYDMDFPSAAVIPHDIFYITPTPIRPDHFFLQVNRAGITCRTPADFYIARNHTYPFSTIHCVISGKGSFTVRDKTYPLERGNVFFFTAHEGHTYRSDPEDPMGLVWVEFGGGDSHRLTKYILDSAGPLFSGSIFQEVMDLCTSLLYQPDWGEARVSQILYNMLMVPCRRFSADAQPDHQRQDILDYIDANLGKRLTLADVAGQFGYHPTYFSSRFSQIAGQSFSNYLLHRRMSAACRLLMTTQLPLDRIAQELGFYDVSHFIARFKSVEGITPARYRRESRGLAASSTLYINHLTKGSPAQMEQEKGLKREQIKSSKQGKDGSEL